MNNREERCVNILSNLSDNYGILGVKTSFEDEGATFEETIRLKQICNEAKTKITLKIGGPEAIRDLKDAITIGVNSIVAPMIESSFGLTKFISATKKYIPEDISKRTQLLINIETKNAVLNSDEIFDNINIENLYGITVGRVDLVSSMGYNRDYVDSEEIFEITKKIFTRAKQKGLKACLGGAITSNSFSFIKNLYSEGLLDKFETRYIIYDPSTPIKKLPEALIKGQEFEYEWLMSKREKYLYCADSELSRIDMIEKRKGIIK